MLRFLMTRVLWETTRRDDIRIDGLDDVLPVLGLSSRRSRPSLGHLAATR
jgi:hypothetical protein